MNAVTHANMNNKTNRRADFIRLIRDCFIRIYKSKMTANLIDIQDFTGLPVVD